MRPVGQIALIEPLMAGGHALSRSPLPRLGLPILATQLERMGIRARVFAECLGPVDWAYVRASDAVFLSALTMTAHRAYALAAETKRRAPGAQTVLGGPHATFLPEEAAAGAGIDLVFRGEADDAVGDLVAVLNGEKPIEACPGLTAVRLGDTVHAVDRQPARDLDDIPAPEMGLVAERRRMAHLPMEFSRGCPHECDFCGVSPMFGQRSRRLSLECAVDRLRRKAHDEKRRGVRPSPVFVYDDNHTADPEWAKRLWEAALEQGVAPPSISMQAGAEVTNDEDLMAVLRRANCRTMFWGIDSIDDGTPPADGRRPTTAQVEEALRVASGYGIRIHGMFVVGFDGDTVHSVRRTAEWAMRHELATAQFLLLTPFPGSPLRARLELEGRIADGNWAHYDARHVVFEPSGATRYELLRATARATARFYSWGRVASMVRQRRWSTAYLRASGRGVLREWHRTGGGRDYLRSLRPTAHGDLP